MDAEDNELYELPSTELRARLRDAVEKALDEIEYGDELPDVSDGMVAYTCMARRHAELIEAMSRFVAAIKER